MRVTIYVLRDADGLQRYVGKSKDPSARFKAHQRTRFPWAASWEALETCDAASWEARERYWIAEGRARGWPIENIAEGGNAVPDTSGPRSPEHCAKLSAAFKIRSSSSEYRGKLSAALKGRSLSPAHRAVLSAVRMGHPTSSERRAKIASALKGRAFTPERRANISAARRGIRTGPRTRETRAKILTALRGRSLSAQHRSKLSAAKTAYYERRRAEPAEARGGEGVETGRLEGNQ